LFISNIQHVILLWPHCLALRPPRSHIDEGEKNLNLLTGHFTSTLIYHHLIWGIKGEVVRTVLYCIVYDTCAQRYAHTWI